MLSEVECDDRAGGGLGAVEHRIHGGDEAGRLGGDEVGRAQVRGLEQAGQGSGGASLVIPTELHRRIDQAMAVCGSDPGRQAAGKRFVELVSSDRGRAIMRRYGFLLPGESLAEIR